MCKPTHARSCHGPGGEGAILRRRWTQDLDAVSPKGCRKQFASLSEAIYDNGGTNMDLHPNEVTIIAAALTLLGVIIAFVTTLKMMFNRMDS